MTETTQTAAVAAPKKPRPAKPTAAIVAPGQSPAAALAALAALHDDDAEPAGIDWSQPQVVGQGLYAQVVDGMLMLAVPVSEKAKAKAKPSKGGKMKLLGNSGGFKTLQGLGIRISVNVGF